MKSLVKSLLVSLWFMFLTFPIMVIRVNTIENTIDWRWMNIVYIGVGSFVLSFVWRWLLDYKAKGGYRPDLSAGSRLGALQALTQDRRVQLPGVLLVIIGALAFPHLFNFYHTNVMVNFLIWVVLGLGLNIVVGLAGLLDLGFVAFYAVGAYSYALLNHHFGLSFWVVLPIGMLLGAFFGLLLGYPVLRLRGDYLAIVTLGFGEIIRLVLENWSSFTFGPSGISNIDRPPFFGIKLSIQDSTMYMYYIMLALVIFTIFVVTRLKNSRIGRAWLALKEDEIACQAMGIDKTKTKLTAFALGATWAGLVGVVFAAKTTFVNPMSFSFMESAIILSIVVVGGMGSIPGVILGALVLVLSPEFLRGVEEYRMLAFGAFMVLVMVFRPQGLISAKRKVYTYKKPEAVAVHD
ncbi:MAG: branched-chain amino acid ABC transporter permease [Desulfovibrionaceae bacterium]